MSKLKADWLIKLAVSSFKPSIKILIVAGLILSASLVVYLSLLKTSIDKTVDYPVSTISGSYVAETDAIDNEINQPLTQIIYQLDSVSEVRSKAYNNSFEVQVEFLPGVDAVDTHEKLKTIVNYHANLLPEDLKLQFVSLQPTKYLDQYSLLLGLYTNSQDVPLSDLQYVAQAVTDVLNNDSQIENANVQPIAETIVNPDDNSLANRQTKLSYLSLRADNQINHYQSILIGVNQATDSQLATDEFSQYVNDKIKQFDFSNLDNNYQLTVAADLGSKLEQNLDSLKLSLLSGLIAVIIVSCLLLNWRITLITTLFILVSLLTTLLIIYLIGFSLNLIVLFALVLSLGLLVSDATVIADSLNRFKVNANYMQIIQLAIKKVGVASLIGSLTTILAFIPFLFISQPIAEVLRTLPITVIIGFVVSFVLSLIVIPFLARFILFSKGSVKSQKFNYLSELIDKLATKIAVKITTLNDATNHKAKYFAISMIVLSLIAISASIYYASNVKVNFIPSVKDGNHLHLVINLPNDYSLEQTKDLAPKINTVIADSLGDNLTQLVYLDANQSQIEAEISLIPYQDRSLTASDLIVSLNQDLRVNFNHLNVEAQLAITTPGTSLSNYPLTIEIFGSNSQQTKTLINDINNYLTSTEFRHPGGQTFTIDQTKLPDYSQINRIDGRQVFSLQVAFSDTDTTSLVNTSTQALRQKFDKTYLLTHGYSSHDIKFSSDLKLEKTNFGSLFYIVPIIAVSTYLILAFRFKSTWQPLVILLAVPFAFLGVMTGLYYTNNAISMFTILILVGLVALAMKHLILLTDLINQMNRGNSKADLITSIAGATYYSVRPIVISCITTSIILIPLAFNPLWQVVALSIIFGLLSSAIFIIGVFPYWLILIESIKREWVNYLNKKKIS